MIKVLLVQYYTSLASLLSKSICASSKMRGNLLLGQKRREMSNKGIAREGGAEGMRSLLPHRYFIFGSDVKLCI